MDLILLPGMDGTGVFFERLIEHLGEGIDPVVVSYPENEPLEYEDLLPLVTSRFPSENPFIILGESFSGPLALMAAAEKPENLRGVILVATFVRNPTPVYVSKLRWLLRGPLMALRPKPSILIRIFCPGVGADTKKWIAESLPRLPNKVVSARINAILNTNVRKELKNCPVPVMYIAASRDRIVKKNALDDIWICRPDVEIKVLDGPHIIIQIRPAEAAAIIEEFCSRHL